MTSIEKNRKSNTEKSNIISIQTNSKRETHNNFKSHFDTIQPIFTQRKIVRFAETLANIVLNRLGFWILDFWNYEYVHLFSCKYNEKFCQYSNRLFYI